MDRGWDATGLLKPLWERVGGRDELEKRTRIRGTTLSSYNSGARRLGERNGRLIAEALGVTVFDLGAPASTAGTTEEQTLIDHLRELAETVERLGDALALLAEAQRPALRDQLQRALAGERG